MAVLTNFGVPTTGAFGSNQTLMPKLQYRFRVTFDGLGGLKTSTIITQNVISATRPGIDHDDVTIDTYNSKIRLAGKHMWQDTTIVLRDDASNNVISAIRAQLNRQVNHASGPLKNLAQESAKSGLDYKFNMKIETLDGTQQGDGSVIDAWALEGCFIPSATFGDLNYATSDVVQVSMTIRFDNAQLSSDHDSDGPTATIAEA
jgi:hypothetical protein